MFDFELIIFGVILGLIDVLLFKDLIEFFFFGVGVWKLFGIFIFLDLVFWDIFVGLLMYL